MTTAKAQLKRARVSPQKMRRVANAVRGMSVKLARVELGLLAQRAAPILLKLLASAIDNAKQKGLPEDVLIVRSLVVEEGPVFKRFMPRAHGRATPIRKRTSHVTLVLEEK
ncbi:MAG: large subunit ribosomal protein L22 [Parcubacteria group bacterium Gr01-1014_70]|nr:MAG: large subunit ribosomal protein L22 [Parcubacteria group bacterium Gr01-1014_70]